MYYIWQKFDSTDVDEASESWSELDGARREVRRVELYPDGQMYVCGMERGNPEALNPVPFPEDLRTLDAEEARAVSASVFADVWTAALERPDALMGMYL